MTVPKRPKHIGRDNNGDDNDDDGVVGDGLGYCPIANNYPDI